MPIKSKKVVEVIVEKPVVEECIIPPSVFTPDDSELLEACENGDLDTVYSKLWNQANVNCRKPLYGSSPLGVACRQGNGKVVNVLLEFGARPTMHDEYGVTPMHWAANSGNSSIIHTLMNKGKLKSVDLGKKDLYGSTPLHFASIKNLSDSVYTLVLCL
jgi:ankyrin repeat protein